MLMIFHEEPFYKKKQNSEQASLQNGMRVHSTERREGVADDKILFGCQSNPWIKLRHGTTCITEKNRPSMTKE